MNQHISEQGLALIQRFEGFAPRPYVCPAGYLTVGYGHVVRAGEDFSGGITEEEGAALLARDARAAERAVIRLVRLPLTQGQFDALASFVFNLGAGAFQRSMLRRKVNAGEHGAVPHELMKWVRGGGRVLKGLVLRRRAEARLYFL